MLFIGDDWAEAHHDIEIQDGTGRRLIKRRLPEGIEGLSALHALVADHLEEDAEPEQVLLLASLADMDEGVTAALALIHRWSAPLCANDDETLAPCEFRLGRRRTASWLCPTFIHSGMPRRALALRTAAGRRSCRRQPQPRRNCQCSRNAGFSRPPRNSASWLKPTVRPTRAGSLPFCAAKAFTRRP